MMRRLYAPSLRSGGKTYDAVVFADSEEVEVGRSKLVWNVFPSLIW